jgi:hypothetical protein
MSGLSLNTITENASRLGMRLQESFSERTRDLSISRGSASMYLDAPDDKMKNLGKQLDSNSDREKLDAMKRLVAVCHPSRHRVVSSLLSNHISSSRKDAMFPSISPKWSRMLPHKTLRFGNLYTSIFCAMQNKNRTSHSCRSIRFKRISLTQALSFAQWPSESSAGSEFP